MTTTTPTNGTDELPVAVVLAAIDGDHDAFGVLMDHHLPLVRRVVGGIVRSDDDRNEAVQMAFSRAWEHLPQLREPRRFRAWLMQIARRSALDLVRRQRLVPTDFEDQDHLVPSTTGGVAQEAEANELASRLEDGLRSLRRRDAVAITLAAQLGFGPSEIGAALHIEPGNAKVVLHRARKRLRLELGPEWFEPEGVEE